MNIAAIYEHPSVIACLLSTLLVVFLYEVNWGISWHRLLRRTLVLKEYYSAITNHSKRYVVTLVFCTIAIHSYAQLSFTSTRTIQSLNNGWLTIANDSNQHAYDGFEKPAYTTKQWKPVSVPHNWDAYEGYRRMLHGNRHGYAWYRNNFTVQKQAGKRYFLFFEGVGSYATVWLNGKQVGYHAGGRTTFTIDVTEQLVSGKANLLAVRADHPANIQDLPWVCGGCSDERGFSEGSQPMGIFRPVQLIVTNDVRVQPFGVHVWNNENVSAQHADVFTKSTIKNYSNRQREVTVVTRLINDKRKVVAQVKQAYVLQAQEELTVQQDIRNIQHVRLWSLEDPYLYNIITTVEADNKVIDLQETPYGIRWISWPVGKPASANQFLLNGKPVFINGIAEYEHLLGQSHAFSDEQVYSRVRMVKAAGFNAFRDGHQPHNLRYHPYWDKEGILWWTQLSAHVWYDTKAFRGNFKALLKEWVIERRNSPSVILWGLQNESKLPEDFAKECTDLIRSLDPTTSTQRLVTTCNGGEGTDWNVPQNWTGTYGGNPATYDRDVKKQLLIGEYGAWRTLDLHTEGGFQQGGPLSEDRMTQLMELKVRLAEQAKDSTCGHFFWLLSSHDNPGRVQGGEGLRELDRIGPINYKGLFTPWEEPADVFYMFRSNYANKYKDPMVYIVSHTWPNRWVAPGIKDSIIVYSNCDEVELFNDVNSASLGRRKKDGIGTHFQWDGVNVRYNVLYAVGYVNGKAVARDTIALQHLPKSPKFALLNTATHNILKPAVGKKYVYRVNCGGPHYTDELGNTWMADKHWNGNAADWGSVSWTDNFIKMPYYFASQRRVFDAIKGTRDWPLFQTFRYGRDQLAYHFALPNGPYEVELYFIEPWLGKGSSLDCSGMRLFDVAVNGETVLHNIDLWKEAGSCKAVKKTVTAVVNNGQLTLHFPQVAAGQAVISAIAIRTATSLHKTVVKPAEPLLSGHKSAYRHWMDIGDTVNASTVLHSIPPALFGADWFVAKGTQTLKAVKDIDVYVGFASTAVQPTWLKGFEASNTNISTLHSYTESKYTVYKKRVLASEIITLEPTADAAYYVAMHPVFHLEPAYDLKPINNYKFKNATLSNGIQKTTINEKEAILFEQNDASVEWSINTGVADVYSLTLKYSNLSGKQLTGELQLLSADGTLMKKEAVIFTESKIGKWNYITTNTGSQINAGNYVVKLVVTNGIGLGISGLDVQ